MGEHSIFALELCLRLDERALLQYHLRTALPVDSSILSLSQKWQSYHNVTQLLGYNLHAAERGCWDYFDDSERAHNDFEMWKRGMTTAEGARPAPYPLTPQEPRYLTFTMAFLLVKDSPSDLAMRRACEIPQERLWLRQTFAHLLQQFGAVSFSSVFADVAYLIPREPDWSLTLNDLAAPKFEYLRRLG